MRIRHWTYCLLFAGATGGIPLVASLMVESPPRRSALSIWDVAAAIGFFSFLAMMYSLPVLVLLALNLDLSPAAPTKGDLTYLLGQKRRESRLTSAHGARSFRPGQWPLKASRATKHAALAPDSPLDHLVHLKRGRA